MNKEGIITEIQKDLKSNNKIWNKNIHREIIFIILTILFTLVSLGIVIRLLSEHSVTNVIGVVYSFVATLAWAYFAGVYLHKSDECRKKEKYLKKALWIVKYWITPTIDGLKLDQSFFKYNYPTEENRSSIDYVLNHINMEIKEKK